MQVTFSVASVLGTPAMLANPLNMPRVFGEMVKEGGTTAFYGEVTAMVAAWGDDFLSDPSLKGSMKRFLELAGTPEIRNFWDTARMLINKLGHRDIDVLYSMLEPLNAAKGPAVEMAGVHVTGVSSIPQVRMAKIGGIVVVTDVGSDECSNAKLRELDLRYEVLLGNVLSIKYSDRATATVGGSPVTTPGEISFRVNRRIPRRVTLRETERGFDLIVEYLRRGPITASFDMQKYAKTAVVVERGQTGIARLLG